MRRFSPGPSLGRSLLAACLSLSLLLTACDPPNPPDQPPPVAQTPPAPTNPAPTDPAPIDSASLGDDTIPGDARPQVRAQAIPCPTEFAAPYDTSRLSLGLYWYAPGLPDAPGGVGCRAFSDGRAIPGYYDPAKPVILFVHGWQPGFVAQGRLPGSSLSTRRDNFWFEAARRNVADHWLHAGWNVGMYHWTQLADEGHTLGMPFAAQAKIWTAHYAAGNAAYGMRWKTLGGWTEEGAPTRPVGELFYAAYVGALRQWRYAGPEPVRVLGHSLGAQLALALAEQAYRDPALPAAQRPRRLILADPYWTPAAPVGAHSYQYLAPDADPASRSARIAREVMGRGAVIEWLRSSPLLDLGGDNNPELLYLLPRTDLKPEYQFGSQLGEKHGVAPRWYLWSLDANPAAPVSAAHSLTQAATLMRQHVHYEQFAGRLTADPSDDTFVEAGR